MKRREFIAGLGATVAWPLAARAQQGAGPVLGFLGSESRELWAYRLHAFHQGLNDTGYFEGRNFTAEYRFVDDEKRQLPALAVDLVSRNVTAIAAFGGPVPARAAMAVNATIPSYSPPAAILFRTASWRASAARDDRQRLEAPHGWWVGAAGIGRKGQMNLESCTR
jgi:hypothetical protein